MSAVVINGGLVHYEAFGRGTPILFIHGWLGSWRYWFQTMESLAAERRVYALDLWGFGDSDKTERRFTMDQYITLLTTFVEELGLESPVIVGHAFGAAVALEYVAQTNASVQKIMTVNLPLTTEAVDRRLANYTSASVLSRMFRWKPIPTKDVEDEANRAAESAIPLTLEAFSTLNIQNLLKSVSCDILLVYGEKDDVVDPKPIEQFSNGLDNVRQIGLSGSRHFPMIDEDTKFTRLLKDFSDKEATLESLSLKEEWRRRTR